MTLDEATIRVAKIRDLENDSEIAHGREDDLYLEFIQYVSSLDIPDVSNVAKVILRTQDMPFERWYA